MKSLLSLKNIHRSPPTVSTSAVNSVTPPRRCSHSAATTTASSLRFSSFVLHPQSSITQSSSYPNTSFGRCRATSSGPPSPPQTDPPTNEEDTSSSPGIMASFSKAQDTMQIFFAVLFWMSLFFWYSVWDGKNDGRPNKGSRFRR
ncbi:PREDICTED: uncharacterized protein LOC109227047 [Nicotiana attenuata]|uniref:uncharacterized protein LOC109227047 n=1 Tax=Nicotiana attenuata TaxID=49451 RepID=UPI0009059F44|nr:PREDICTED: uncharacterized protein LOC109227047 [Nicotiana attenuata]